LVAAFLATGGLRLVTVRRAAFAALAFLAGAAPLVLYNSTHRLETLRANSSFAPQEIVPKFGFLLNSVNHGIFDWMIAGSGPGPIGRVTFAFVGALALWWFAPRRRAMLFAFVFMAAVWLLMAVTRNAGASVHHTALMWPFPQFFIAVAFGAEWPQRWKRVAI